MTDLASRACEFHSRPVLLGDLDEFSGSVPGGLGFDLIWFEKKRVLFHDLASWNKRCNLEAHGRHPRRYKHRASLDGMAEMDEDDLERQIGGLLNEIEKIGRDLAESRKLHTNTMERVAAALREIQELIANRPQRAKIQGVGGGAGKFR